MCVVGQVWTGVLCVYAHAGCWSGVNRCVYWNRGLYPLLNKWLEKGFNREVRQLQMILEAGNVLTAKQKVVYNIATNFAAFKLLVLLSYMKFVPANFTCRICREPRELFKRSGGATAHASNSTRPRSASHASSSNSARGWLTRRSSRRIDDCKPSSNTPLVADGDGSCDSSTRNSSKRLNLCLLVRCRLYRNYK